ncbi:MAG TPA: dipeptidase [Methanotrichaceae archaeon]|nr:dipeptidase [Methanotrichaceae archaeon]
MKERYLKSKASAGLVPSCTTIAVGKKATIDGSVIIAHSDDDVSDERVIYVPASDPNGGERNVYYDNASLGLKKEYNSTELRRYIGPDRGPGYDTKDYQNSIPLGKIPQVEHTYAYFDCSYGIMNEHQLMIGECTCGAKVHPEPDPKKRIFYSAELSRVALERCTTSREAIVLIAYLIENYGLYGTGETLLIGDTEEAWFMEMCGYDENGEDGIWVAKRVPDNGFAVGANQFRIDDVVYEGSSELDIDEFIVSGKLPLPNFKVSSLGIEKEPFILRTSSDTICSGNLFKVCEDKKWWDPSQGPLYWLKTVSWGEYFHPYYSLRRVWRAISKVAPGLNLPAWVEDGYTRAYHFSVVPEKKLSVADVVAVYRDHYEGTEFDLTRGRAGGPFHDPTRYEENPDQGNAFNLNSYHPEGAWERPLSIYRCGMISINQARGDLPDPVGGVSWIGLDRPAANCLMPFFVGVSHLPKCIETMNLLEFDFNSNESAWWAFNFVANYATIKYSYMMEDIREKQREMESVAYEEVSAFQHKFVVESGPSYEIFDLDAMLAKSCEEYALHVVSSWWDLAKALIVKYNDGCITTVDEETHDENIMKKAGYPKQWLCDVGYYRGPTSYQKNKD